MLKTEEAAAAFFRTINEGGVILASAYYEGASGRRLLCANRELREVKGLGWHMRALVLSSKLGCESLFLVIQSKSTNKRDIPLAVKILDIFTGDSPNHSLPTTTPHANMAAGLCHNPRKSGSTCTSTVQS